MLRGEAVESAGCRGIDAAAIDRDRFRHDPGARQRFADQNQFTDLATAFLYSLATDDVFRVFRAFDDAGDDFDLLGSMTRRMSPDAELFDQNDFISHRIVGQNRRSMTAFNQFPVEHIRPASFEPAVTKAVFIDFHIAVIGPSRLRVSISSGSMGLDAIRY